MKLVFGLGNPGTRYQHTRHNLGFMVIDELARRHGIDMAREKFQAWFGSGEIAHHAVGLAKPTTFVNRSGQAVCAARNFYKVAEHDLMVIVDDLALDTGKLRFRGGGSAGGHNGLASINQILGTQDYPRLRVGIGSPPFGPTPHVLGRIDDSEWPLYDAAIRQAADGVTCWLEHGIIETMNRFNGTHDQQQSKKREDEL